jgi:hypothetical protein
MPRQACLRGQDECLDVRKERPPTNGGNHKRSAKTLTGIADEHDNKRIIPMTSEFTMPAPGPITQYRPTLFKGITVLVMVLVMIGLGGCRTAPIRDMTNQPVPPGLSSEQVSKVIQSAGNSLGWAMSETRPGLIEGNLFVRDHTAKIEIPFSSRSYSIRYVSSSNLKYNASNRSIHSNYNGWIQNLDNQIRSRLASM